MLILIPWLTSYLPNSIMVLEFLYDSLGSRLVAGSESWILENGGSGGICNLWLLCFSFFLKFLYPRQRSWGGYIVFTMSVRSVRPSVRPSVCRRKIFVTVFSVTANTTMFIYGTILHWYEVYVVINFRTWDLSTSCLTSTSINGKYAILWKFSSHFPQ